MCCGTKRLTEIDCPPTCGYLTASREHPPAVVVRQQQRDVSQLMHFLNDFNRRQSQLFLLICSFLTAQRPSELQPLIDDDVAEASRSLAATFETASRGVIYEHRPASLPAERLVSGLKPLLAEAGKEGGSAFERDAAAVLRRIEGAVTDVRAQEPGNRRAFLELVGRMIRKPADAAAGSDAGETPRLIVP